MWNTLSTSFSGLTSSWRFLFRTFWWHATLIFFNLKFFNWFVRSYWSNLFYLNWFKNVNLIKLLLSWRWFGSIWRNNRRVITLFKSYFMCLYFFSELISFIINDYKVFKSNFSLFSFFNFYQLLWKLYWGILCLIIFNILFCYLFQAFISLHNFVLNEIFIIKRVISWVLLWSDEWVYLYLFDLSLYLRR